MIINGIDCKVKWGYQATRAFKVVEQTTTSAKKFYLDYGYEKDDVTTSFTLIFTKDETVDMNLVLTELVTDSTLQLECDGDYETIFGSEIDYSSSIECHVISMTSSRTAYERYEITVSVIVKNPPRNTAIPNGNVNSLLVPHAYTSSYNLTNAIFNGSDEISSLQMYTDDNTIEFGSLNTISKNAPIKTYLIHTLRTSNLAVPSDWKTYLNVYEPFDLTYMTMEPVLVESFNAYGMSTLNVKFTGVNE